MLAEGFGLPDPMPKPELDQVREYVLSKYKSIHADFDRNLRRRALQAEQAHERLERLDAEIAKAPSPTQLFDDAAVEAALCKKLESLGLVVPNEDMDPEKTAAVATEAFCSQLSRKGASPSVVAGHNPERVGEKQLSNKGTGKGKGKGNGKGKQKGKKEKKWDKSADVSSASGWPPGRNGPRAAGARK